MKSSDYIVELLEKHGIKKMFVFTGGAIAHLIDAVYRNHLKGGDIEPICVMHEQAGSFAADGYARTTGKPAAMAVTSGPGATNLITGLACSWYDSIPGIYITGQVRTWEYKAERKMRQLGFQETDIVSIVKPITNYAVIITKAEDIRYEVEKAIFLTTHKRPGPVVIDLPMDMQWAEIDPKTQRPFNPEELEEEVGEKIQQVVEMLKQAKQPVIISGGGIRNSNAVKELKELAEKCDIPVVVTFGGADTIARDHRLYCGLIGTMGNPSANKSLMESDLVLAIGSRLSWRQIKAKPDNFLPNAKLVHVEIDPDEMNQKISADLGIVCDAKEFLEKLTKQLGENSPKFLNWATKRRQALKENPICKPEYYKVTNRVHPYVFYKELAKRMGEQDILVADAGHNIMWAMQGFDVKGNQRLFTSHAHSPMGYAVMGAMGAAIHHRSGKPVVVATIGDGGFQLNIQDLQTIVQYKIPVKVFIIDNQGYGAIKDYQNGNLDGRHFASSIEWGYVPPNLLEITKAYKIPVMEINSHDELDKIDIVLKHDGPIVCNVVLIPDSFVSIDP